MYATGKGDLKNFTPNSKFVCGINDGKDPFPNNIEGAYRAASGR
jgi:hypothetical protein